MQTLFHLDFTAVEGLLQQTPSFPCPAGGQWLAHLGHQRSLEGLSKPRLWGLSRLPPPDLGRGHGRALRTRGEDAAGPRPPWKNPCCGHEALAQSHPGAQVGTVWVFVHEFLLILMDFEITGKN